MDNLDDFKAIWHAADTKTLPSSEEMLKLISNFRGQKLRNKWLVIISSLILCVLFIAVLCIFSFRLWTTYIGGSLMALASLWLAINNFRSIKRFRQLDDSNNLEFIAFLEQTRKNQVYYYTRTMVYVLAGYSAGYMFYIYELIYKYPTWFTVVYSTFGIYVAVMWFVVRPRAFRRDAARLNAIQQRHEKLLNQFE